VDGIVWDLRGVLPFFEEGLVALMDARDRLLTPGGTIIPLRDTVWAAPVDAPEVYRRHFRGWDESACGFDLQGGRRLVAQSWSKATVAADQLLAEPGCWVALDYRQIQGPDADATVTWIVRRDGTGHGFAAWFETELAEGIGFSNAPDQPELLYGQAFFPWPEPVPLRAGDEVSVHWQARLVGRDYVAKRVRCVFASPPSWAPPTPRTT
jgi:protein arginine N-methyltransferase 1